ncbi:hypothetical protein M3Y96_00581700 [Aphelenchoides besseyi]|nr:hypothetical protein M3Y96_00581700 [Aphelenchoides besseyi]
MISFYELLFYYSYGIPLLIINIRTAYILTAKRTQFSSSYYRVFFLCALNIWRKYTIPILFLSFGGTFVLTVPTFFTQIGFKQIKIDNSTNYTTLTLKPSFVPWDLATVNSITVGLFTFLGLIVNAFTLYFWQKRKSLIPERHQEFQSRLLFLTIVIYSLHFISFLYNTFKSHVFTGVIQFYRAYGAVSDSMALIPSLAIILVSPTLRLLVLPDWIFSSLRSTWKTYGFQSTTNGNATSIVVQPYSPNRQTWTRTIPI